MRAYPPGLSHSAETVRANVEAAEAENAPVSLEPSRAPARLALIAAGERCVRTRQRDRSRIRRGAAVLPEEGQASPMGHHGARKKCGECHEMNDHNGQGYVRGKRHGVTLDPPGAKKRENVGLNRVKNPHLEGVGSSFGEM